MKKKDDILQELGRDLPRGSARPRKSKGKSHAKAYGGMGLRTYSDSLGNEVPLPLNESIIRRAPALLRNVAELWRRQGMNVMAQQFTAANAVIGVVLDGCYVRQQENLYMLNLQVMIVGGAGSGKSRVALLDRLVEPIDHVSPGYVGSEIIPICGLIPVSRSSKSGTREASIPPT